MLLSGLDEIVKELSGSWQSDGFIKTSLGVKDIERPNQTRGLFDISQLAQINQNMLELNSNFNPEQLAYSLHWT